MREGGKVKKSSTKWSRFITTRMLNGSQQTVKTITTVTIILIIWKEERTKRKGVNK